jgi:hypothetical protein
MQVLKQSVNSQYVYAYMVNATDGYTPVTNVTSPLIFLSANGASAVVPSDGAWAAIHPSNMPGWYRVRLNATDTSQVGLLGIDVYSTGTRHFGTVAYVSSALLDTIRADTQQIISTLNAGISVNVASIADAVWDEPLADHLTSGSTGSKLNTASAAADPWSALTAAYTDTTTFGGAIGRAIGGSGYNTYTLTVEDADDHAVEGVRVDVYTTSTPSVAGYITTGVTNSSGQVTFYLPTGTYYVYRYRRGYTFTDPLTITVS